jgi:hypothetical protein
MRTSWEKLVQHVGTAYGEDITSNELTNRTTVTIAEPVYPPAAIARHAIREELVREGQVNMQIARMEEQAILEQEVAAGDRPAKMKLAALNNEIAMADYEATEDVIIKLTPSENTKHQNAWRTYREQNAQLVKSRGKAISLILGQCTQLLQDKMKQDADWISVTTSYDPLTLYRMMEKTTLAQTGDQYPFATVYEQETGFYLFQQHSLTNAQWYERFNTKIDIGAAIGVTRQHQALLERSIWHRSYTTERSQPWHLRSNKLYARQDAEERYIAYAFLRQSGKQHESLQVDLKNGFTTGDNRYPKNRQQTLQLLDNNYSKISPPKPTPSEGSAFAQKGDQGDTDQRHRKGKGKGKQLPKRHHKTARMKPPT